MNLSDFDFDLPQDRIAHHPARPRESARLLHVADALTDRHVRDLPDMLRPGDLIVANDTRVIPAQLEAKRGEARIGITLDQQRADGAWHALARNARKLRDGDVLDFSPDLSATIEQRDGDGGVVLRFAQQGDDFIRALNNAGALALPPYIERPHGPVADDQTDYQTTFAQHAGAVAAPTAGLHFTPDLLAQLAARGIETVRVTLHVGAGTFLPVRNDDVSTHRMHPERGIVREDVAARINQTRAAGGRIVAIGTTALRLLESAAQSGTVQAYDDDTSLFILPGFRFQIVDLLLTNFHLPRSTLFMLVSAFAGTDRMRAAYDHAVADKYRFYSYGDASLLERAS